MNQPDVFQKLAGLDGLWWLLALLVPFLVLQRGLHRQIQAVFLLLTRRSDIAMVLFAVVFFPGVLLHEASHFLVARLTGVRTGGFSLVPRPLDGGRLQLGYVETAQTDPLRDALIGLAPLLTGGGFVAYAGLARLGLTQAWEQLLAPGADVQSLAAGVYGLPDFWLWLYLIFAISSTMMPSPSDRRAWLPVISVVVGLLVVGLAAGAGPWLAENLAGPFNDALRGAAAVFGISLLVHCLFFLPFFLAQRLLARLTGYEVV